MIPSKVKVAGIEYAVIELESVDIGGNKNYQGACFYELAEIHLLSNGVNDTRKEQTFVHELVHAVLNEAGYDDHDEEMVNRIGIVLHQVLKDNRLYFGKQEVGEM